MMKKRFIILILAICAFLVAAAVTQTAALAGSTSGNCSDLVDNDADMIIDFPNDPGCENATDTNESDIAAAPPPLIDPTGAKIITFSVSPLVEVGFSEFIVLKSVYLYALNEETAAMMAIGQNPPSIPVITINESETIIAIPMVNLFNGLYDLVLNVEDLVGNPSTVHQKFIIEAPVTDINIVQPRLGVSNGSTADLVIETKRFNADEPTECKITTSPFIYDFQSEALVPFAVGDEPTWAATHTLKNFFTNAYFSDSAVFYILCNDTALHRVNRERFEIYIDRVPPGISSFEFNPAKVVEYPPFENKMRVILNVTANEPVICKYSFNESKDYELMTNIPGFNPNVFGAYTKNNNTLKYYLPDASPASHDFYVQCEDRAGWKTPAVKGTLQVDLSAGLEMTVVEPKPYTTNKSITLKITTIKRASCVIGNTTADYKMMNTDVAAKTHTYYLGQFSDGSYTYNMKCTGQGSGGLFIQEQQLSYTFVVDNTKPSAPNMTGSKTTCFQTKFEFTPPITISATDAESNINYYLYKMDAGTKPIVNWTKTKGDISTISRDYKGDDLNLTKAASYKISAKAVNGAGLEGPESSITVTYNPDDISCYEKNPPVIVLAKNETEGKTLVEIACSDESGCDNQSYYYGLCDSEDCDATTKIDYPFILTVYDAKYMTYNVSDIHGYSAKGTEKIEVKNANTCANSMKDGEEADIDCGGKCEGCDEGKICIVNTDCKSNTCLNGTCVQPKCDDKVMNGPYGNAETDVDCGGYCGETCAINKTCNNNGDCISAFCNPDEKKCRVASCSDSFKNGNETGADCGGDCGNDCNDKNGNGIDDAWEEKYCNGNCDPNGDLDGDGLNNLREYQLKTDPTKKDTDGDGYSDYEEVQAATDPLDPESYPKSIVGILLIFAGFLFMAGGICYLVYKNYFVEKPMAAAAPAKGTAEKTPEQIAEEKRAAEEQQRKLMEQQRKAMEERQKRYDELRAKIDERRGAEELKKKTERESLFGKFGAMIGGSAQPKAQPRESLAKTEKVEIKPKIDVTAKVRPEVSAVETPKKGMPKEDWPSIDKLKESFGAIAHEAAVEKIKKTEQKLAETKDAEFSKLEEMTKDKTGPKKEDVFEEIEKTIKGENEGAAGKEEDLYKDLGEISGKSKKKK